MAVADPDHAGLPPLPDTSVLGFDREDHDILGYTDLQLRDYALSAVIQALQKLRITGRAPDGDHVLEIFAYSAANGRRQVMVSLPIPTPQVLDDKRIRDIFLANGFTIKEGLDDLKPYVYQAAYELIDATRVALIDEDGIGPIVGVASDGTNHTLEFLNAGVSPAGLTLRVRLPDLPPAEAVSLLQEVAACAAHDPQRKSATRCGRYVVLNMTSALHARLLAAAKGMRHE